MPKAIPSTAKLTATITGGKDSITWSSSNTSVATVSSDGTVTAVGHGTATIYVKGTSSERRPVTMITVNVAKTAWITADTVNVRSGPSTGYSVVGSVNRRAKITVYGDPVAAGASGQTGWYSMKYGSIYGYVSADYVSFTEPKELTFIRPLSPCWKTDNYSPIHGGLDLNSTSTVVRAVAESISAAKPPVLQRLFALCVNEVQ